MNLYLNLPFPPSVNNYWRTGRGVTYLSKNAKQYRREVQAVVLEHGIRRPMLGRIHLKVYLHAPTKRAYDIDNKLKALLDSMEHAGVYENDGQIDIILVQRGKIEKPGRACVMIQEWAE